MNRFSHSLYVLIAVWLSIVPSQTNAMSRSEAETQFRNWLATAVNRDARAAGVKQALYDQVTETLALDWSIPDLRPPGSGGGQTQRQAEFGSPGPYFNERTLSSLAATGRSLLARHGRTLDAIERRYGVPRRIVVAIWGKESAFGRAKIPHNALRILATQAFMGARKEIFYPELIAALKIIGEDHIAPGEMKSSWAGALGQPQFLPSKFLQYAVDFDGDGKRDIWGSEPDTLASIANFLHKHGWQTGRDWGFEAVIPASISCALEGPEQGKLIAEWARMGATRVSGNPFPDHEARRGGYLLMPAGRHGPAFIATDNFYVLKSYNESDLYALYIGNLADRMAGGGAFKGSWQKVGGFQRSAVAAMQRRLEQKGHDVGGADGLVGFKTRIAVGKWQTAQGQTPTCFPDAKLVKELR